MTDVVSMTDADVSSTNATTHVTMGNAIHRRATKPASLHPVTTPMHRCATHVRTATHHSAGSTTTTEMHSTTGMSATHMTPAKVPAPGVASAEMASPHVSAAPMSSTTAVSSPGERDTGNIHKYRANQHQADRNIFDLHYDLLF